MSQNPRKTFGRSIVPPLSGPSCLAGGIDSCTAVYRAARRTAAVYAMCCVARAARLSLSSPQWPGAPRSNVRREQGLRSRQTSANSHRNVGSTPTMRNEMNAHGSLVPKLKKRSIGKKHFISKKSPNLRVREVTEGSQQCQAVGFQYETKLPG